ncbi:MAG TPA: UbiD family decarboxylase [Candidatus Korarchaeota archaeon]|nr:UbiD family decarboxylase [Candidatus Korarchaeota archaeon]
MGLGGLRKSLETLENAGLLRVFEEPLSVDYEIAKNLARVEGSGAALFKSPILRSGSSSQFPVAGGVASSRETISSLLGVSPKDLWVVLRDSIRGGPKPAKGRTAKWDVTIDPVDLDQLPILRHYTGEAGPYITAGIVIAYDKARGIYSVSYHRMLPVSKNRVTFRAVEGRKLHRLITEAEEEGSPLDVAVAIGVGPGIMLAGAIPAEDRDKLEIAGALEGRAIELTPCEAVDADAPVEAEIVLEGRILPGERANEGPFYEIFGKDVVRKQPVMEIRAIRAKSDAVYQAILPGGKEHELLMGLPVEPVLWEAASKYAKVVGVAMTPGGGRWIEAAVAIEKEYEGQPVQVALAMMAAHKSLKRVIVVDSDIDVYDYEQVMRAVVQRAYPPKDYVIIENVLGSSLDHCNLRLIEVDGETRTVRLPYAKVIIDATVKGPRELYARPSFG